VKGMPEAIIDHCAYFMDNLGQKRILTSEDRVNIEKISRRMGERGLRPILLAYTQIDVEEAFPKIQSISKRRKMKESSS
jgi:magnesium-transporting ATPase (P-type)